MKTMSRISRIIDSMPIKQQAAVIAMREQHACLMELDRRNVIPHLQSKAVYLNYMEGTGRRLSLRPHYYEVSDAKGGVITKQTFFTYIDKVK